MSDIMEDGIQQRIRKIKRLRAGKKGSITKRINQLSRLLSEGGSRSKIKYLLAAMFEVHKDTKILCEELDTLLEEPDIEWIEEVNLGVDTMAAEIQEYIDARHGDPPSEPSLTSSWVREHAASLPSADDEESVTNVVTSMADLTIHGGRTDDRTSHIPPVSEVSGSSNVLYPSQIDLGAYGLSDEQNPAEFERNHSYAGGGFGALATDYDQSVANSRMLPLDDASTSRYPSLQDSGAYASNPLSSDVRSGGSSLFKHSTEQALTTAGMLPKDGFSFSSIQHPGCYSAHPQSTAAVDTFALPGLGMKERSAITDVLPSDHLIRQRPRSTSYLPAIKRGESFAPPGLGTKKRSTLPGTQPTDGLSTSSFLPVESSSHYPLTDTPGTFGPPGLYFRGSSISTSMLPTRNHPGSSQLQFPDGVGALSSSAPCSSIFASWLPPSHAKSKVCTSTGLVSHPNLEFTDTVPGKVTHGSYQHQRNAVSSSVNPQPPPSLSQNVSHVPSSCGITNNHAARTTSSDAYTSHPVTSQMTQGGFGTATTSVVNQVDGWIEELDNNRVSQLPNSSPSGTMQDVTMAWLVQQSLPRVQIPSFDGSPTQWVGFITKFKDLVHDQVYLSDTQRNTYLLQHLKGEAKRSVTGYSNDGRGYVLSLKRLKFLFGQKSKVAQSTLLKVTQGKAIRCDDHEGLLEFYYIISDCLVTLHQLNYEADLYSSDTLRQAVRRLPNNLHMRWAEHSLYIRDRNEEPNLIHLEAWLMKRVLAMKESYLPNQKEAQMKDSKVDRQVKHVGATQASNASCPSCNENHVFWKCMKYKALSPAEKFEMVMRKKCCYNCFKKDHTVKKCKSKNTCFVSGCGKKHHTTLHKHFTKKDENDKEDGKDKKDGKTKKDEKEKDGSSKQRDEYNGLMNSTIKDIFLQIVPVTLHSRGKTFSTYALLDSGSQSTLLRADVADTLALKGKKQMITMTTVKDKAELLEVQEVSLEVSSNDGEERLQVESAYVVPGGKFNMPSQRCPTDYQDIYTHLDGIKLEAIDSDEITILIGANVPEALLSTEVRRGSDDQPLAIKTMFGWTLFGASHGGGNSIHHSTVALLQTSMSQKIHNMMEQLWQDEPKSTACNLVQALEGCNLERSVEAFWKEEHCAILPPKDVAMSREDEDALNLLESSTRLIQNRYEVPMLWKESVISLPNNISQARRRFEFLTKRLKANPELHKKYSDTITDYVVKGYARKMNAGEARITTSRTWYLPHHPVFNPNKPGKIRVVFDAAAEHDGQSLNNALVTGPDLLNSLVGVLIRFRNGRIAIAADIEAMFHQVMVRTSDADSLRFLWKDDIFTENPPYTMQMLVHIFGAKDSPTCANYALKLTARDNYKSFSGLAYESMLRAYYVDDLLKAVGTEEAAISLTKELMEMAKLGGFRLTKLLSNSKDVIDALPPSEVSPKMSFVLNNEENIERTLGVCWETNQDVFTFSSSLKEAPVTKRGILQTVSSVFDPLGFLTPFILKAKILLQELWRQNTEWDEAVDAQTGSYWRKWLEGAKTISSIKLSRRYNEEDKVVAEVQLHIFCDASELAYGCAAYLRLCFKDGSYKCNLVMSKSKLAPIKTVTLPRLELNGAVTAVRLYRTLIHEIDLPIEKTLFWTDSTLTLQYIRNKTQRPKVYVANRVTEIVETTSMDQWNFVPGKQNPADMVTRGIFEPSKLMKTDKYGTSWYTGPSFLQKDEACWPEDPIIGELDKGNPEIKKRELLVALGVMQHELISPTRFSSWTKLKRVVAWLLRFLTNCRTKEIEERASDEISCEEISNAQHLIFKDVQRLVFHEALKTLQTDGSLPRNHQLSALSPFVDKAGMLRVGGRLKNAPIPEDSKHQCILPKNHPVTNLIITHEHVTNGHIGAEHVLANLREFCWILNGRTAIRSTLRRCFFCRVRRARIMYPFMANLPAGRLAYGEPPFTNCGVDLFGPLYIKQGRKRIKRWAVLFTCLTIRCVHLEVVEGADTDSFINTLRRFTNRRGCPNIFYSDCGSNFKGATTELKDVITELKRNEKEIIDFATTKNILWKFNPPAAPHMGGVWERLVRSVKEVMSGLMKDRVLTDPQLATLLTEVENILNSRPLTRASEDAEDLEALTPYHILLGRHKNWSYMGEIRDEDVNSRKQWKQVQALGATFWKRWKREYLPTLTIRTTWRDQMVNYKVGELVILSDDDTKRGKWPLARITKVMPSEDGIVRVAEVLTKDGTYTRPVAKLLKLEDDNEVPQGEGCIGDAPIRIRNRVQVGAQ